MPGVRANRRTSSIGSCGAATAADHDNAYYHEQLQNQIQENHHLTEEVLDLKMRLADALARIDAEQHERRLQSEQIAQLCDENDELRRHLDAACGLDQDQDPSEEETSSSPKPAQESSSSSRPNEGWLHRVASNMKLGSSATNPPNPSPTPDAPCSSATQLPQDGSPSKHSLFTASTRRLSMLTADLADEQVSQPSSSKGEERRRSSMTTALSSYSSLTSFPEGDALPERNSVTARCS